MKVRTLVSFGNWCVVRACNYRCTRNVALYCIADGRCAIGRSYSEIIVLTCFLACFVGETSELCKWTVDLGSLPPFQQFAQSQQGFYTGS